jgi:hypothetical protein
MTITGDNGFVAYLPKFINLGEVDAGIKKAEKSLAPDVVRIRYNFAPDWSGDPSIFFRVVLSDDASRKQRLSKTAQRVALVVLNQIRAEERGLHAYFNYRSLSEQNELKEPAWA